MILPEGILLVCFGQAADTAIGALPRVLVWHEADFPEEVALSKRSRLLLGTLVTPVFDLLKRVDGTADHRRMIGTLAAATPAHAMSELGDHLHFGRTQMWRMRTALADELDRQSLTRHLVSETRGRIELRDATSDVAAIVLAADAGQIHDAVRLLTAIHRREADGLATGLAGVWPPPVRDAYADAVRATAEARDRDPETGVKILDAEVVCQEDERAALSGAVVVQAPEVLLAGLRPRPSSRRSRLCWKRALVVAGALLAAGTIAAVVLIGAAAEHPPAYIPDSVAGRWPPGGYPMAAANLTRRLPFDAVSQTAAVGDELLLRARFRLPIETGGVTTSHPATLSFLRHKEGDAEASLALEGSGVSSVSMIISHVGLGERLVVEHGTAKLLDDAGRPLRRLNDLEPDRPIDVGRLTAGRVYYLETRVRGIAAPPSTRGELATTASDCTSDRATGPFTTVLSDSDVATCRIPLLNWGPRPLRTVAIHLGLDRPVGRRYIDIAGSVTSPDAFPRTARVGATFIDVARPAPPRAVDGDVRSQIPAVHTRRHRGPPAW